MLKIKLTGAAEKFSEKRLPDISKFLEPSSLLPNVPGNQSRNQSLKKLLVYSKANSTWSKHCSAWTLLNEYEIENSMYNWPMNEKNARDFVVWALEYKKLKPSTVKTYLSSIKLAHVLNDMHCTDFGSDPIIKMLLTGAENLNLLEKTTIRERPPMSLSSLKILGHRLAITNWKLTSKQLIWSACATSFFSSCRMGELLSAAENSFDSNTTLLWKHVTFFNDYVALFIPYTKCKGLQGHVIEIYPFDIESCCPFSALTNLKNEAEKYKNHSPENPVFMFPSGIFLTTKKLNEILKALISSLGEGSNYSCHSFRAAIPSLISAHPDKNYVSDIMEWGEWSTPSHNVYTKFDHNRRKILFKKISVLLKDSLK